MFGDPYFSFDGSFSLPMFSVLRKNEENLSSRSLIFLQNFPSNSIHLTSSSFDLFCRAVSKGLRFVKIMAILEILDATNPLIQNIIRIVCLC